MSSARQATALGYECSRSVTFGRARDRCRSARDELKQRVAPSLCDVVLETFIDSEAVAVEDGCRRPDGRAEEDSEQTQTTKLGERLVHQLARLVWRELGRVHRLRPAAATDDRLAGGPEVPNPVDLPERGLDEASVAELPHRDRRRVRPAGHAAAYRQKDVRLGQQATAQDEPHERPDRAEERSGYSLTWILLQGLTPPLSAHLD
jgi:hypothetical protein